MDSEDQEMDYDFEVFHDAVAEAQKIGNCAVVAVHYEYSDTTLEWTPDNSDTWPPSKDVVA